MNPSNILTRIKLKLGLSVISTMYKDLDQTIMTILNEITIPVFSIYQPFKESIRIDLETLDLIEKTNDYKLYLLPEFKNRNLLYVFNVTYDESCSTGFGYYGGTMPLLTGNLIQQTMLSNSGAQLMSLMMPKVTYKYEAPRKLYIYNAYASYKMKFDLGFEHDKSMATIDDTCRESFLELALLDVKENLYPSLKMYTETNTAIGNINLKINDWENAETERKELINRWDDTYHLDFIPMYYY